MTDSVNKPVHYTYGKFECIDVLRDILGHDGFIGFCRGNVIKYLWRYAHKNHLEDLKKARWYLDRMISEEETTELCERELYANR